MNGPFKNWIDTRIKNKIKTRIKTRNETLMTTKSSLNMIKSSALSVVSEFSTFSGYPDSLYYIPLANMFRSGEDKDGELLNLFTQRFNRNR